MYLDQCEMYDDATERQLNAVTERNVERRTHHDRSYNTSYGRMAQPTWSSGSDGSWTQGDQWSNYRSSERIAELFLPPNRQLIQQPGRHREQLEPLEISHT